MSIITISRGTFSGGRDLAERLAARLGYPCLSREVITEAAMQYGVPKDSLSAALARAPSLRDHVSRDRDKYLNYIRAVLCQRARAGQLVYHGYAGHHLLAGIRHVIRVRVVADIRYRIEAAMRQLSLSSRQAETHIQKIDEDRRKWTRFLYGVEWEDPSNYDMVLNLEYLGVDGACELVTRLTELEMFQQTEASQAALEDLALGSLVTAALARDPRTTDGEFRVSTKGAAVTVDGIVRQQEIADAVVEVASAVDGVKEVQSHVVTAQLPSDGARPRTDE